MRTAPTAASFAALVVPILALALLAGPYDAGAQQPPASSSRAIFELRYAGHDPFSGGESAIFLARLSDNSDEPIASAAVTAGLSYKFALSDDTDWRCVTNSGLTSTCTRTLPPIGAHLTSEVPIIVGTVAGVCLDAAVNISVIAHFADGDETLTATSTAPSGCPPTRTTLPATGARPASGASPGRNVVLAIGASILGAASIGFGVTDLRRRRCR
jgi:hypothetical protein